MYRHYGWRGYQALPEDLVAFAWSAPMRELARQIGISDVGLRKLLKGHGVILPPQGHWNRVHAGRAVAPPPQAPARRPGETGRVWIDDRFAPFVAAAKPFPASGPFASAAVPEDLEGLRARELKAIGRTRVPAALEAAHPGLRHLLGLEERRRQKVAESSWHWDLSRFDGPLDQRKLRLFNGIFLALAKRGHGGAVSEHDHEFHASVTIGDTCLGLALDIVGKHRTVMKAGRSRPAPDLRASTPLVLRIVARFEGETAETWQDGAEGKLESRLPAIVAALIVAGEARFRLQLRADEERVERDRLEREARAERVRIEREQRQIEKLEQLNRQRIADLQRSGELLRLSRDIRALVEQVRVALASHDDIDTATLSAWQDWALAEADRIDPVLSGQILSHLRPPVLEAPQSPLHGSLP